jgi:hypothetical protein
MHKEMLKLLGCSECSSISKFCVSLLTLSMLVKNE